MTEEKDEAGTELKFKERPEWRLNTYSLWRWQDSQEHREPSLTYKRN